MDNERHAMGVGEKVEKQLQKQLSCAHVWAANGGQGGEPDFRLNRQMSSNPLMYVRCDECGARTWFTEEQWFALDEEPDTGTGEMFDE